MSKFEFLQCDTEAFLIDVEVTDEGVNAQIAFFEGDLDYDSKIVFSSEDGQKFIVTLPESVADLPARSYFANLSLPFAVPEYV